jgi:hypothetical protein
MSYTRLLPVNAKWGLENPGLHGKARTTVIAPDTENRTVAPRRRPNAELRAREYLTEAEVRQLIEAAKRNRSGGYRIRAFVYAGEFTRANKAVRSHMRLDLFY